MLRKTTLDRHRETVCVCSFSRHFERRWSQQRLFLKRGKTEKACENDESLFREAQKLSPVDHGLLEVCSGTKGSNAKKESYCCTEP
jgi:hypothetical protein